MKFDEDQLEAIRAKNNVLVVAGAGSGKTTTIVGKINHIIDNNIYTKEEVLVISFTNETVKSLKEKVKYNIDIKTFHKLALDVIKKKDNLNELATDYDLKYIIKEYLLSYGKHNKSAKYKLDRLLSFNDINQIINLIFSFINIYKCNYSNMDYLYYLYNKSYFTDKYYLELIIGIYITYQTELKSSLKKDFNDLIIDATNYILNKEVILKYKYIIIDEFQDISLIRFNLVMAIIKTNNGNLFAVGDDYQSIYRFSGCDLSLFINFDKYLPDVKIMQLNHNYRSNQSLVNIANKFIMKNKLHLPKNTLCIKDVSLPIKVIYYKNKKTIINKVLNIVDGNSLILGRNNRDKDIFNITENDNVKFLTVHSAKGMEEDNIILINLYNDSLGFPSKILKEDLIMKVLKSDYIMHEEERRLFYVALTRSKNYLFLLVPYENQSVFVKELIKENKKKMEFIHFD